MAFLRLSRPAAGGKVACRRSRAGMRATHAGLGNTNSPRLGGGGSPPVRGPPVRGPKGKGRAERANIPGLVAAMTMRIVYACRPGPSRPLRVNRVCLLFVRKHPRYNGPVRLPAHAPHSFQTASMTCGAAMSSIVSPDRHVTLLPSGAKAAGLVGPNSATVGAPTAAARCETPESLPM